MNKEQLSEVLASIKKYPIYIPSLKKEIVFQRLDSESLSWVYDVVNADNLNQTVFNYTKRLWDIPFNRCEDDDVYNMSIVDAMYSILKLRIKENPEYADKTLEVPEEPKFPFVQEYPTLEVEDDSFKCEIVFGIPTLRKVIDTLDVCQNQDAKDYAFYLTFKFVDCINIPTSDGSVYVIDDLSDMLEFFNDIPQKYILEISKKAALVAADLINYSKIDLESDVGFLLNI